MSALEDELAVRNLAAAYTDAVNRGDLEGMLSVYTDDAVLIPFGGPEFKGRDAIRNVIRQSIEVYEWIYQMTHSGLVKLEGDKAHCRWWVSEVSHAGDGKGTQFYGLYQDVAVRSSEGWRFASRRLDANYLGRLTLDGKQFPRPGYTENLWP